MRVARVRRRGASLTPEISNVLRCRQFGC